MSGLIRFGFDAAIVNAIRAERGSVPSRWMTLLEERDRAAGGRRARRRSRFAPARSRAALTQECIRAAPVRGVAGRTAARARRRHAALGGRGQQPALGRGAQQRSRRAPPRANGIVAAPRSMWTSCAGPGGGRSIASMARSPGPSRNVGWARGRARCRRADRDELAFERGGERGLRQVELPRRCTVMSCA